MKEKRFYIEFKIWNYGTVDIDYEFKVIQETNDYRHKNNISTALSESQLRSTFMSFNEESCREFFESHDSAIECAMICPEGIDIDSYLSRKFGYYELLGTIEITQDNFDSINNFMKAGKN